VRSVGRLIDPKQRCVERSNMISQISEEFVRSETLLDDYRDVRATHTRAYVHVSYVNPNRSLGMPITGRPLRAMKGHLLLSATVRMEGHEEHGDVISGDLAKLLAYFKEAELAHEITHDPSSGIAQSAVPY
jgi:hypothetical protein